MTTKSVLNLGQIVYVGNKGKRNIRGEITAITIRSEGIRYEVTWWKDDVRKSEWVLESELSVEGTAKKSKLGF